MMSISFLSTAAFLACGTLSTGIGQYPYQLPQQQLPQATEFAQPSQSTFLNWNPQPLVQQRQLIDQVQQPEQAMPDFERTPVQMMSVGANTQLAEDARAGFSQNLVRMAAKVPMHEVMEMMQSVEALQRKTVGLRTALLQSQQHEKQLNAVALAATSQSATIDQKAQKLARLAQESVNQAQKSIAHEKEVEKKMEKEKADLQQQLFQSEAKLKQIEVIELQRQTGLQLSKFRPKQEVAERQMETISTEGIDSASSTLQDAMRRLTGTSGSAMQQSEDSSRTEQRVVQKQMDPEIASAASAAQLEARTGVTGSANKAMRGSSVLQESQQPDSLLNRLRRSRASPTSESGGLVKARMENELSAADTADWEPAALWIPDAGDVASTNDNQLQSASQPFPQSRQ